MKRWSNFSLLSVLMIVLVVLAACAPEAEDSIEDEGPPPVDNVPAENVDTGDDVESLELDTVTDEDRGVTLILQDSFIDEENSLHLVVSFMSADGEDGEVSFTEDEFVLVDNEGVQNMPVLSDGSLSDINLTDTPSDPVTLEYAVLDPATTFVLQVPGFDSVTIDAPAEMQDGDGIRQPNPADNGETRDDNDTNAAVNYGTTGDDTTGD